MYRVVLAFHYEVRGQYDTVLPSEYIEICAL